ncbi:MAG: hypothetical protein CM1200mP2_59230 [Planctomycetaceae bacterium]|nr:MAG: hypothetical protein CM1200mP2_59230 [Planctomycetaceae bacterium]
MGRHASRLRSPGPHQDVQAVPGDAGNPRGALCPNFGERFSFEVQLYAAAGYIVLYTNPRGSTGYGRKFADLIDHNYPREGDFQDMMSGLEC